MPIMGDMLGCPCCRSVGCPVCSGTGVVRRVNLERARAPWNAGEDPEYADLVRLERVTFHQPMFTDADAHDEHLSFTARAHWDEQYWNVEIVGQGWVTFARTRLEVRAVAEQLIVAMAELPPTAFEVEIEFV